MSLILKALSKLIEFGDVYYVNGTYRKSFTEANGHYFKWQTENNFYFSLLYFTENHTTVILHRNYGNTKWTTTNIKYLNDISKFNNTGTIPYNLRIQVIKSETELRLHFKL